MLKEIKCFQPARTGIFSHPDRYYDLAQSLRLVGIQGSFVFVDGVCSNWQGEYIATIVGDLPDSERMRADRFEETKSP